MTDNRKLWVVEGLIGEPDPQWYALYGYATRADARFNQAETWRDYMDGRTRIRLYRPVEERDALKEKSDDAG